MLVTTGVAHTHKERAGSNQTLAQLQG